MRKFHLLPFILVALTFALAACGPGNSVRLLPAPPISASNLPTPNSPTISVVTFTDKRPDPDSIGTRRDGSAFTTQGDVSHWMSRALADKLAREGMQVTYATTTAQARSGNPDYLVTGVIEDVWLKESSAMEISAHMRLSITLANRKGKLWTETSNTTQSRASLPSGSTADNLLLATLDELLKPLTQKILQTVGAKK